MIKENKVKTLQIRIGEEDYNRLVQIAFMMGLKPSSFARQIIQMSINASKLTPLPFDKVGAYLNENNETNK